MPSAQKVFSDKGSYLGVVVTTDEDRPPKIQDLMVGSWAQRSDVLCVGDVIVGVNAIQARRINFEFGALFFL